MLKLENKVMKFQESDDARTKEAAMLHVPFDSLNRAIAVAENIK